MSAEQAAIAALRAALLDGRAETLRSVLAVLETGGMVGECFDGAGISLSPAVPDRLRAIRDDLVELDLYRLHYGPLPVDGTPLPLAYTVSRTDWPADAWVTTWSGGPT